MDYCKICKKQTKSNNIPSFIKRNKRWRRKSVCRICNSEKNNISVSPKEIEIEELFKPARKHFTTSHFIQRGIDDTWQADLYTFYRPRGNIQDSSYNLRIKVKQEDNEYKKMLRANNGYKYILNVIDTFSKYVWAIPLKTKSGLEVANAFESIMKQSGRIPNKLHVDQGKEFYNKNLY